MVGTLQGSKYSERPVVGFMFTISERVKKAKLLNALLLHRDLWDSTTISFSVGNTRDSGKLVSYILDTSTA